MRSNKGFTLFQLMVCFAIISFIKVVVVVLLLTKGWEQNLVNYEDRFIPCVQKVQDTFCQDKGHKRAQPVKKGSDSDTFQCVTRGDRISEPFALGALDITACEKLLEE